MINRARNPVKADFEPGWYPGEVFMSAVQAVHGEKRNSVPNRQAFDAGPDHDSGVGILRSAVLATSHQDSTLRFDVGITKNRDPSG